MSFEKVGRLKPDEEYDSIRVIVDDTGEIGRISRERMEGLIAGLYPVLSSSEVVIELQVGEVMIRILGWQVKGMLEKWPWKKAGVFPPFVKE
jgi:hypothetical protein